MELKELAKKIAAYRVRVDMTRSQFARAIGVCTKTLARLEQGGNLGVETRKNFIRALELNALKKGDPVKPDNRPKKESAAFADISLPPSFGSELNKIFQTASRYQNLVQSWGKTAARKQATAMLLLAISQLITELKNPASRVPMQRHCMLMGLLQGFMIKEGVITILEALEDQNTLYYVDTPLQLRSSNAEASS